MKKLLPIIITLLILLAACGTIAPEVSLSPSPTSTATVESVSPSASTSTVAEPTVATLTKDEFVGMMDKLLEEQGFLKLSSGTPFSEDLGTGTTAYGYVPVPNVSISLYESNNTKNLTGIFMTVNTSGITKESLNYFGYANAITINGLEDEIGAAAVDAQLNMSNITESSINYAESDNCSYTYMVDGTQLMFMVKLN